MHRMIPISFILFALAGCVAPQPVVSDVNDSSVKIQAPLFMDTVRIDAKAAEACAIYGKTRSDQLSHRDIGNFRGEFLYACK